MAASRNLVHDTLWRRARHSVAGAVHDLDDLLHQAVRAEIQVLFEAASPMSLVTFGPMLERLQPDSRLGLWFTAADRAWSTDAIYQTAFPRRVIGADRARWRKFDAYVNTDFWNMTWLPRRTRRIHLFHGVAGKYGLDAPVKIAPVVASFDRLLFPNHDRLDRYAAAGLVERDGPRAALVGYPKVDCLVDGSLDRAAIERELGLDPSRPTVLYAPTWSASSSLNVMGEAILEALAGHNLNVVVKIHDRSYDPTDRASGGVDWRARLTPLCRRLGAHLAQGADAAPYLFAADALVTDHSSVGSEFMLLDRPIVVVDCPQLIDRAAINRDKVRLLRSAAAVAATPAAVARAVEEGLGDPFRHSDARRAIAGSLFYRAGGATDRAVHAFYDVLGLTVMTPMTAAPALSRCETRMSSRV